MFSTVTTRTGIFRLESLSPPLPFGICFDLIEKTLVRDFICRQNNIVTNVRRIPLYPFFGNNVDMNSAMSFRKVGAAFFKCVDKKNTFDSIVIWCKKQLVTEAKL